MAALSPTVRAHFDKLCGGPLAAPAALRDEVLRHAAEANLLAERGGLLDAHLADRLADACGALLDAWPQLSEAQRRQVQGACRYFAAQDDDDGDFASVYGLDDDAEVVAFVAAQLGRDDIARAVQR